MAAHRDPIRHRRLGASPGPDAGFAYDRGELNLTPRIVGSALVALAVWTLFVPGRQPLVTNVEAASGVRGIYRFSSTAWSTLAQDGFNWVTDGGTNTNNYAGQRAAGLNGMVWLPAYDNSSCKQTMTDAEIQQVVQTNASGGNGGATYQVGDEPTANGCAAAPTYSHMTAVIHGADRSARTWVADDQFNDPSTDHWPAGLPMKGTVDILAFDIYPCQAGPCQLNMIDLAVQRIHSVGLTNWEFILQDFGPCESWRAPSALEVTQQFQHWQGAGALGYWIYTYDSDGSCPGNVAGSSELRQINSTAAGAAYQPPPAAPSPVAQSPKPKASPLPTSVRSPVARTPLATHSAGTTSPGADAATSQPGTPKPALNTIDSSGGTLVVVVIGVVLALVGVGLTYFRRRPK